MSQSEQPAPMQRMKALVDQVRALGLYPDIPVVANAATESIVKVAGGEYLLFSSNNVLGSGGSRMLSANLDVHVELERRVAEFLGREDCICFATGYMANIGVIPALMKVYFAKMRTNWQTTGRWDLFSEELNHASGVDGIRLSQSDVHIYPHKDMAALGEAMATSRNASKLIMSDGVFSMDGDIAPVGEIVAHAKAHGTMVMIDDAHGIGVLGAHGRGSVEHLGVSSDDVQILMGTFTKAFGGIGGFIAGRKELVDFLRISARTYIFSAPLPPGIAAGLVKAVEIAGREPQRREKALENAGYFRGAVEALGYDTLGSEAHIVPVLIGREDHAGQATRRLRKRGIIAPNARFPAVAVGRARLRFVMTSEHSREQIDYLLKCLGELRDELKL